MEIKKAKLYHLTLKENLPLIMKNGLIPKKQKDWIPNIKAIFFWDSLEFTRSICDEESAILQVEIPEDYLIGKWLNEGWNIFEFYVMKPILPENIKIIQEGEKI